MRFEDTPSSSPLYLNWICNWICANRRSYNRTEPFVYGAGVVMDEINWA
jgi:hypothetical protein